jgi:hypothetical protein
MRGVRAVAAAWPVADDTVKAQVDAGSCEQSYCSSPMTWTTTDRVCGTRRCSHT